MNRYLRLTLVLFLVALLSGVIVGTVYYSLEPVIAEVEQKRLDDAAVKVFGEGSVVAEELESKSSKIDKVYVVEQDGSEVGYLIQLNTPNSYSSVLNILVGINKEDKVEKIAYLTMQETFTAKVKENKAYNEQFIQYDGSEELDTISGASISTGSINSGVNIALDYYNKNLKQ